MRYKSDIDSRIHALATRLTVSLGKKRLAAIPRKVSANRAYKPFDHDIYVRFARKVTLSDTCWLWESARPHQYVVFCGQPAHRWSYTTFRGHVPYKKDIDHLCRTPSCVNPWHLEIVSRAENIRRGYRAKGRRVIECSHHDGGPNCKDCVRKYHAVYDSERRKRRKQAVV